MSALLRSGKFLRLVSGFARQPLPSAQPGQSGAGPGQGGGGGHAGGGGAHGGVANSGLDAAGAFQAWSLQHMNGALPVAGAEALLPKDDEAVEVRTLIFEHGHRTLPSFVHDYVTLDIL